jgi:hypothetical protein
MVLVNEIKNILMQKINDLLNIENEEWQNLDKKTKLKYIHRYCNMMETNDVDKIENLSIPLKSLKPKKLLQLCGFSKTNNKEIYSQFNQILLNYTFNYRNLYLNNKIKSLSNLNKSSYFSILNDINEIVFSFINKNKFNPELFIKSLCGSNVNKIINHNNNYNNYILSCDNNKFYFLCNNIKFVFTLKFINNNITNNIHVKYFIEMINFI